MYLKGLDYYRARDALFPIDKRPTSAQWNKSADRLLEVLIFVNLIFIIIFQVHEAVGLLDSLTGPTTFIDVHGGPGHFSQLLFHLCPPPVNG